MNYILGAYTMRTFLLRLGVIGDSYKQARKILTRGLSGSGSYAKAEAAGVNDSKKEEGAA
jgi:phage-related minor tail protein